MLDLFDSPAIAGLDLRQEFITRAEESLLVGCIEAQVLEPFRFQQWTGKRLAKSFGWHYDFQSGSVSPTDPIPEWLLPLRERVARFASLPPFELVQALLLKYGPGAGINWHKDRPIYEHVFGISLGAAASMRFRKKRDERWERMAVPLEARALYRLSGDARHDWEHSIVEMVEGTRYSITFRTLSASGRKLTARM